jgi:hypothetical protein
MWKRDKNMKKKDKEELRSAGKENSAQIKYVYVKKPTLIMKYSRPPSQPP